MVTNREQQQNQETASAPAPSRQAVVTTLSLGLAVATLTGCGLLTYRFAGSVPARDLFAASAWIGGLALLLWLAALRRADRRRRAMRPKAGSVSLLFVASMISVGGLVLAFALGPASPAFRLHWPLQILLLAVTLAALRRGVTRDDMAPAATTLRQGDILLARLAALADNASLTGQPPLSPAARVRAALGWWEEELRAVLDGEPSPRPDAALSRLLNSAADDIATIEAALASHEPTTGAMVDIERRVLGATHRTGRLRRRRRH
ncbi:hypothetical protein [Parapedomonas caeni]